MSDWLANLKEEGEESLKRKFEAREAAIENRRLEDQKAFMTLVNLANDLLKALGIAPQTTWKDNGGSTLRLVLGEEEAVDGELIYKNYPPAIWYYAPYGNGGTLVRDREHLARMIAARSSYE